MKRYSPFVFKYNNKKQKIINNKQIQNNDDDDNDEENPLNIPKLFKQDDDFVYINNNHVYYHTEISEKTIDQVKKCMREYLVKVLKVKNNLACGTFIPKPLILHIYSPGGDVYAAFSLFDYIIEYSKTVQVYTIVDGLAASAATIISVAGVKRFISPNSYMLIHQLSTFFGGNFEQIKDEYDNCDKLMKKIKKIYVEKTRIPKKQITNILQHDITWDAEECKKYGLVDEIKLIDLFNDHNL